MHDSLTWKTEEIIDIETDKDECKTASTSDFLGKSMAWCLGT